MSNNLTIDIHEYAGGVMAIDAGFVRQDLAACYLLEADAEVAIIEVGTNGSTPRLMKLLQMRGWQPEDVRYVIVTHVHLDHAGGAGSLMQLLPNATLLAHPYGARHLINPAKLEAGARTVYGDALFDRMYGTLIPVPESRTQLMDDGSSVTLGNRTLSFMDSPGHARHHFCVHDSLTNGYFSGDTFGLSYREFDTEQGAFLFPTTTPVQFDPVALKASVRRLMASKPDHMYLTHFGRVSELDRLSIDMLEGVDKLVELATKYKDVPDRTQQLSTAMTDWLMRRLRQHGCALTDERCLEILGLDVKLNVQGLEVWLDKNNE